MRLLSLTLIMAAAFVYGSSVTRLTRRQLFPQGRPGALVPNTTVAAACSALFKSISPESEVYMPNTPQYEASVAHYIVSSAQYPVCVFVPTKPKDLSIAMQLFSQRRVQFALSSGKYNGNPFFSSTFGIQVDMKAFNTVALSKDKSSVTVGAGQLWDNVYEALKGTGRTALGARAIGIGMAGFHLLGGGYSWKSNQEGLATDSIISISLILPDGRDVVASKDNMPDLFFALKGGGNQFGIVHHFQLKTFPQTEQIWGGYRGFTADAYPAIVPAVWDFLSNNKDPKATIIPTFNFVLGMPILAILAYYDGPKPPAGLFDKFNAAKPMEDDWKARPLYDLVRNAKANSTYGLRGRFHTVSLQKYSPELVQLCANETAYWGSIDAKRSGAFFSIVPENVMTSHAAKTTATANAWSYHRGQQPLSLYFAWVNPADDAFYVDAIKKSAKKFSDLATQQGQKLQGLPLYPNYALGDTDPAQIYGANLKQLQGIKAKYDPKNIMRLTTSFHF